MIKKFSNSIKTTRSWSSNLKSKGKSVKLSLKNITISKVFSTKIASLELLLRNKNHHRSSRIHKTFHKINSHSPTLTNAHNKIHIFQQISHTHNKKIERGRNNHSTIKLELNGHLGVDCIIQGKAMMYNSDNQLNCKNCNSTGTIGN